MFAIPLAAVAVATALLNLGATGSAADEPPKPAETAKPAEAAKREPVRLIFDTDICGDVDDVLALGMIHAMQTRGDCQLLAVTITAINEKTAPFVDAVNTFYGRGNIPIGVIKKTEPERPGKYLFLTDQADGKSLRYPHDLRRNADAPAAVDLLRKTLTDQPDGSVTIAQVGFFTNLNALLDSKPDQISPLSGVDLVKAKVKLLSVMAGAFTPINGNNSYGEYNVVEDLPSARALAERWPTPIVWSGFEIGIALEYPSESILKDYGYVPHHPLAEAYIAYEPPPHNRPTWDLTAVLYAVHPDRGYFELSAPGTVRFDDKGTTQFNPGDPHVAAGPELNSRYLVLKPEQRPRVLEALVQLSSQPPCPIPGVKP